VNSLDAIHGFKASREAATDYGSASDFIDQMGSHKPISASIQKK
jgi:hypothetical protein